MKTPLNKLRLPLLMAALNFVPAGLGTAQTFTTLHGFAIENIDYAPFGITNSDGATPKAGLTISGNTLYGTASGGGTNGNGTVFAVNTDGTGFTNLHSFTAFVSSTNSDGAAPRAGLLLSGTNLYGTTYEGGSSGCGTVFRVNTDGTLFTNLHDFTATAGPLSTNSEGAFPWAGLIISGNTLYGTAAAGGTNGSGTVFALNTDGTRFTNLHNFTAYSVPYYQGGTNSDGAYPSATLFLSGNTLYGTAGYGGTNGTGTVFALNTDGTGFTNLHNFAAISISVSPATNSDGAYPYGGLVLSGNTLYGTASNGGTNGTGTVFALNTDGAGFTALYHFTPAPYAQVNSDGAYPNGGFFVSGNTLYGTAGGGGTNGYGTIFAVKTDGTGITNLHNFANSDGIYPNGGLILSGNTLYGTASNGGTNGTGTVFSLSLAPVVSPPLLNITLSGANVILTWSEPGFTLQSATNLAAPVWITVSGQNAITNPITGTKMFYRLSQ